MCWWRRLGNWGSCCGEGWSGKKTQLRLLSPEQARSHDLDRRTDLFFHSRDGE